MQPTDRLFLRVFKWTRKHGLISVWVTGWAVRHRLASNPWAWQLASKVLRQADYLIPSIGLIFVDEVMWSIDSKVPTQLHLVKHLKLRMVYLGSIQLIWCFNSYIYLDVKSDKAYMLLRKYRSYKQRVVVDESSCTHQV